MPYTEIDRNNFAAITSQPNRLLTRVLRTVLWMAIALLFVCFYALPAAFVLDSYYGNDVVGNILILGISYSVLVLITVWLIRYV